MKKLLFILTTILTTTLCKAQQNIGQTLSQEFAKDLGIPTDSIAPVTLYKDSVFFIKANRRTSSVYLYNPSTATYYLLWKKDSVYVHTYTQKSVNYTTTYLDYFIEGNGTITITLPSAVGIAGKIYFIKNVSSPTAVVTIATTNSQTIDGSSNYSLSSQYKYLSVYSDGTNWKICGSN